MSKTLPKDAEGNVMQNVQPRARALGSIRNTTLTTTATDIVLEAWVQIIVVYSIWANTFINLCPIATDTVTATSFDRFIPSGGSRVIAIPLGITTINAITDTGTVAPLVIEQY